MNKNLSKLVGALLITLGLVMTPGLAQAAPNTIEVEAAADGTVSGAIQWMQNHAGNSGWEGLCEMAVENAYGTTGVWASAIAHWHGAVNAGKAHPGDSNAPRGAFVYWNTSQYGHVGISDGNGGFYSSSVGGAIGHGGNKNYFVNYLGWSTAQVPA